MEIWKSINNFSDYEISNKGRVKSYKQSKTGIIRKLTPNNNSGYLMVILRKGNKPYNLYVHRLVAEAFIPNPNHLVTVNHIDGNILNNDVSNLEWLSNQDNIVQSHQVNNYKYRNSSKRKVRCIETGMIYPSVSEAARQIGGSDVGIGRVCRGERNTYYGYHWEYMN